MLLASSACIKLTLQLNSIVNGSQLAPDRMMHVTGTLPLNSIVHGSQSAYDGLMHVAGTLPLDSIVHGVQSAHDRLMHVTETLPFNSTVHKFHLAYDNLMHDAGRRQCVVSQSGKQPLQAYRSVHFSTASPVPKKLCLNRCASVLANLPYTGVQLISHETGLQFSAQWQACCWDAPSCV